MNCKICKRVFQQYDKPLKVFPARKSKIKPFEELSILNIECSIDDMVCGNCYWDLVSFHNTRNKLDKISRKILDSSPPLSAENVITLPRDCPEEDSSEIKEEEVSIVIKKNGLVKRRILHGEIVSVAKVISRGSFKDIASSVYKCEVLKEPLKKKFLREVEKEAELMCSKKNPSILRKTSKEDITNFKFEKLANELQERAPLLKSILLSASSKQDFTSSVAVLGITAAILLKHRNMQMNSVQIIVNSILQHSSLTVRQ